MKRLWHSQPARWAAAVAWMGLVFYLSSRSDFPDALNQLPDWRDLAAHVAVYAVLALLWERALRGAGCRWPPLWAFVIAFGYGASDELHQFWVPGRNPDLLDWLADAAGAGAALLAAGWRQLRLRGGRWSRHPSRPG